MKNKSVIIIRKERCIDKESLGNHSRSNPGESTRICITARIHECMQRIDEGQQHYVGVEESPSSQDLWRCVSDLLLCVIRSAGTHGFDFTFLTTGAALIP